MGTYYAIIGKYVSGREITGYELAEILASGMLGGREKVTRDRVVYHAARGEIVNFTVVPYENSVRLQGINCTLDSLATYKDTVNKADKAAKQLGNNSNKIGLSTGKINQDKLKLEIILNEHGCPCLSDIECRKLAIFMDNLTKIANMQGIRVSDAKVYDDYNVEFGLFSRVDGDGTTNKPKIAIIGFRRGNGYVSIQMKFNIKNRVKEVTYRIVGNSAYSHGIKAFRVNWEGLRLDDSLLQSELQELISIIDQVIIASDESQKKRRESLAESRSLPKRPIR